MYFFDIWLERFGWRVPVCWCWFWCFFIGIGAGVGHAFDYM